MRQFTKDYLFKVIVQPIGGYKSYHEKIKPYYVVAASKQEAKNNIGKKMKKGWEVKNVLMLAEQHSDFLFSNNG